MYPEAIAGSRYRVYQYLSYLRSEGIATLVCPAVPLGSFKRFYGTKNSLFRYLYHGLELFNRTRDMIRAFNYDVVFIQKGLAAFQLRGLDRLLQLVSRNVVFDFDDAIFSRYAQEPIGRFPKLYDEQQICKLIRLSKHVIAGNDYLKEYALRFNENVSVIPTSLDTQKYFIKRGKASEEIVIGWMGSPGTAPFLQQIKGVFQKISKRYDIVLKIIGATNLRMHGAKIIAQEWNFSSEVSDLQGFDIGVMPLPDNEWTRGKCGFKLLQYMAVGIPAVGSPVGVNKEIIRDGVNGFLVDSEKEWVEKLSLLIEDNALREKLGMRGRETVEKYYSLKVNAPKLLAILKSVAREDKKSNEYPSD